MKYDVEVHQLRGQFGNTFMNTGGHPEVGQVEVWTNTYGTITALVQPTKEQRVIHFVQFVSESHMDEWLQKWPDATVLWIVYDSIPESEQTDQKGV